MPRHPTASDQTTEAPEQSGAIILPDEIRALITDLASEVADLKQQIRDQDQRMPTFQPSRTKSDYAAMFDGMAAGGQFREGRELLNRTGDRRMVVGTDSHPLSDAEIRRTPPMFAQDEYVRLNLGAPAHGGERTWGDIVESVSERQRKARKKQPSTVGRVLFIQFRRDDGTYKYRCIFPGLTGLVPDKDRGDGFDEGELLPLREAV